MGDDRAKALQVRARIGVITALEKEFAAVNAMLVKPVQWTAPGSGAGRRYVLGEVPAEHGGSHAVVLALLVDMGNNSAGVRATQLLTHFPEIRHILMCGIAGGIPSFENPAEHVRFGDVVVSDRNGVVQFDNLKRKGRGELEYRYPPRPPGSELLEAVKFLTAQAILGQRRWEAFLPLGAGLEDAVRPRDDIDARGNPVTHPDDPKRRPGMPRVFSGTVGSSNTLLKDAAYRDELRRRFGLCAVEMEGSGIADATWIHDRAGYLVVRGICDYADENKGDLWQGAAAVAAAAYLRALLESMPAVAPPRREELPCPYRGMQPYAKEDAATFYGRDAEVTELIGRLRNGEREIFVIGPSGSGKSSLVAAGVVPRLERGVGGLGPVLVRTMRPGKLPATQLREKLGAGESHDVGAALAALLAGHPADSLLVIVVDQFEELFTLADPAEYSEFLAALRTLRDLPACAVVLTLRADFFGSLMESPLWAEGQRSRIEVAPLRGDKLRDAITRPASAVEVEIDPALLERLLADAASEPGILPLLQETMVQLWDIRAEQRLPLADYEALGDGHRSGLAVALSRRADATLRALKPDHEPIVRRIMLRLVHFGEGRADTRRQQPRSALRGAADDPAVFEYVLRRLIADRLLAADSDEQARDGHVDLSHEVMLTAWPKLAGWIRTYRAEEQRRRQLEAAAAEWVKRGRGAGGLLDLVELTDAEAWQKTDLARELGQSTELAALVVASRTALDRQRRRRRVFIGSAFAALGIFAVVITMLAIVAELSRKHAEVALRKSEASDRESSRLLKQVYLDISRQMLLDGRPQEAMPYLMAVRQTGENGEALRMLIWSASHSLPLIPPIEHRQRVYSATFSPDGTRVVTASADQTAQVWDASSGKRLGGLVNTFVLGHQGPVFSAAFSPGGTLIVTASADRTAKVWDAATGKLLVSPLEHRDAVYSAMFDPSILRVGVTARIWERLSRSRIVTASADQTARVWDAATGLPLSPPLAHRGAVYTAVFSPDGTRVVTASADWTARVWNADTGQPLSPPLAHQGQVHSAAFSPDGARVVTASFDHTAQIWDVTAGTRLGPPLQHRNWVWSATFSPNGTRVVTASDDHTAQVWDAVTGKPCAPPLVHQRGLRRVAFSPDGTRVVTASADQTARLWDAATGKLLTQPFAHQADVTSAEFSPDGTRVVTASGDKTVRIWDAVVDRPHAPILAHKGAVGSAVFNFDGTRVVTASDDRTAQVWDADTGRPLASLEHQGTVTSAAFSSDGTRVVTASDDRTVRVWDAATGILRTPLRHRGMVLSAAFSPKGALIVTGSDDQTARIWDAATGRLVCGFEHRGWVRGAAFSPDGTRVVTASDDHLAQIRDAITCRWLAQFGLHRGSVNSAAFSPDGTRVVTTSDDQTAQVWDAATGKPRSPPLAHQGAVTSAVFSPDGTRVVTASDDQTAQVWNAATGKPLAPPLGHQGAVTSVAFSPDGTRVVTASGDRTARIWDAATGKPLSSPLAHQGAVASAAFSPDGTRVVTASTDSTSRIWETRLDETPPAKWSELAARSPFVLSNGIPILRNALSRVPLLTR